MRARRIFRLAAGDRGQVLPLVALAAVVLIGFAGLAVDLGRVWVAKQELQKAVDAAALAAGRDLPNSLTAYNQAIAYSGSNGDNNALGGWGVNAKPASVTFECLSHGPNYTAGSTPTCMTDTSSSNCRPSGAKTPLPSGVNTCNAVQVSESATVSTGLLSLFIPRFTINATSQSAANSPSTTPNPENTVVILDTTGSMEDSCSATVSGITSGKQDKLDCAKAGVRSLLSGLDPCAPGDVSCGGDVSGTNNVSSPIDEAGIVVFPALSGNLTGHTTSTTSTTPAYKTTTTYVTTPVYTTTPTTQTTPNYNTTTTYTTTPVVTTTRHPTATTTTYKTTTTYNTTTTYITTPTTYTTTTKNTTTTNNTTTTYNTTTTNSATYNLTPPSNAVMADETDCKSVSADGLTSGKSDTYPPWQSYPYNSSASFGGIPLGVTTAYSSGTSSPYTSSNPYFDNYSGYDAIPLSSDYRDSDTSTLDTSSSIVKSVYWAQCSGSKYPGSDDYGIKDISGQGSYLAGAITEAQYMLASAPARTLPDGQSMTNAIVILSDGEIDSPTSSKDGVAPGQAGNISFSDSSPCESAISAANQAKAAGTEIFSIAYDSTGNCDNNYTAQGLMQDLATPGTGYYFNQTDAASLAGTLGQIGATIVGSGGSTLIPNCTPGPGC